MPQLPNANMEHLKVQKSNESNVVPTVSGMKQIDVPKKETKLTFRQLTVIFFLAFGTFCSGLCSSIQGPFFPKEAESKGVTPTIIGFIQGSMYITIFLAAPVFGKILARFGHAKIFIIVSSIIAGSSAMAFGMLTFVDDTTTFIALCFLCRIVEGIGACVYRTCNPTIGVIVCTDRATTIFSLLRTTAGLGLMLGPLIGGALFSVGGYKLPFLVLGSFFIIDAIGLFFALPSGIKQKESNGKSRVMRFWMNFGTFIYFLILFFCFITYGFTAITLEPHLRQFNLSPIHLGLVFSVSGIVFGVTTPVVGWLIDKTNKHSLFVLLSIVLQIISQLFIGTMPFIPIKCELWIVILACVLLGCASSTAEISCFSGLVDHTISRGFTKDLETYGFVSSSRVAAVSLGCFVGPFVGGYFYETLGYDGSRLVIICAETCLLIVVTTFLISKKIHELQS